MYVTPIFNGLVSAVGPADGISPGRPAVVVPPVVDCGS
jgi:hypothetical protein